MKTKQKKPFMLKIRGKKVVVTSQTLLNAAQQSLNMIQRFQQFLDPDVIQSVLMKGKKLDDLRDILEELSSIEIDNLVEEAADAVETCDVQAEDEEEDL